jgi:hypothetical protein
MKLKIDECLPLECADLLTTHGHEVETVPMEGFQGKPDQFIWYAAQEEKRFLKLLPISTFPTYINNSFVGVFDDNSDLQCSGSQGKPPSVAG